MFHYTSTWTWWERHRAGDELVWLVSGSVELGLERGHDRAAVDLGPGEVSVVPAGTWHTVRVREPSTLVFVTPTLVATQQRPLG